MRPNMLDYPDLPGNPETVDCTECRFGAWGDCSCAAGREVAKPGEQGCSLGEAREDEE